MNKSLLARLRRRITSRYGQGDISRGDRPSALSAPGARVEALEPRLLLSGVSFGELASFNAKFDIDGERLHIRLPGQVTETSSPRVQGRVINDVDGDGYWDPNEHALVGVTVFADVDGDGLPGVSESTGQTDNYGNFTLSGLPAGDYKVRVVMPEGYKAASRGSASSAVSIAQDRGVGGLTLGLVPRGHDLGLVYSDVSLPESFKTGTRVKVPVILTNHGNTVFRGGDTRLRVWVSDDAGVDRDDTRLAVRAFKGRLAPGQSVKIELDVNLPDALTDFYSYLVVDAVGQGLRVDMNLSDNTVVSSDRIKFAGSDRRPSIGLDDLNVVLANWNVAVPYGGYEPGDGFVGIDDLNTILGNWNAGNPPGGTTDMNPVTVLNPGDYWQPWLDLANPGAPVSISGTLVHDPENILGINLGILWPDYEVLAGWTVYLDQNRNQQRDADERWALTAADGSYIFEDLPTNSAASTWPMLYVVHVDAPEGWAYSAGALTGVEYYVQEGVSVEDVNLGFYAPPQVGNVWIEDGYLANGFPATIHATDVVDQDDTVERVVFYYDRWGDGEVYDILGVDTEGSDGYSVVVGPRDREIIGSHIVYAVAQDSGGHLGTHALDTEVRTMAEIGAGKRLVYRDRAGAVVTTALTGPGKARVMFEGDGVKLYDLGGVIEATGRVQIDEIVLLQTTGRSRLKITAAGGENPRSLVSSSAQIRGDDPLGLLYAPKIDFQRGIEMLGGGVIRNTRVGSVHNITMARQGYGNGVKISAREITGRVELGSHLRVLNAGDISVDTIAAPSAGRILVRNDMRGRVELTDTEAEESLGLLQVNGLLGYTTVLAASSIDTVRASKVIQSQVVAGAWTEVLGGSSVPSHRVVNRSVIQNFQAGLFKRSKVSAWRIVTVDLDRVLSPLDGPTSELTYHRLVSYRGPRGIDRTVI